MKNLLIALAIILFSVTPDVSTAQADSVISNRYIRVPAGYLMVLKQGDSLFTHLENLALKEKIPSASFSGMGFLGFIRFGFFNSQTKEYEPKEFSDVELASLTGSIAWENGKPSLHAHGVAGDKAMASFSGHILSAQVGTGSLEILVVVHDKILERKLDPGISAKVLEIP